MRPITGGARRRWLSPELLSIILLLGLWEIVPRLFNSPWLPSFSDVVIALGEIYDRGLLIENVLASLRSLGIGYAVSVVVGLVVGALMGRFRVVEAALDVFVEAALFTPSLILAPIFFAIFGLGDETRIAVVVAYGLPVVILNTSAGVRTVDPGLIEMARSFGSSELTLARRVLLPASAPLTLEGPAPRTRSLHQGHDQRRGLHRADRARRAGLDVRQPARLRQGAGRQPRRADHRRRDELGVLEVRAARHPLAQLTQQPPPTKGRR